MNIQTKKAIMDYNKTVTSHKNLYRMACKINHPKRYTIGFCLPSASKVVNTAFKNAMKAMYKAYKGNNLYYKNQLLRAAYGLTKIESSPAIWSV